jgi:hypothetical protein
MTLLFEQQCRDSKLSAVTPGAEQVNNWNKLVYTGTGFVLFDLV